MQKIVIPKHCTLNTNWYTIKRYDAKRVHFFVGDDIDFSYTESITILFLLLTPQNQNIYWFLKLNWRPFNSAQNGGSFFLCNFYQFFLYNFYKRKN